MKEIVALVLTGLLVLSLVYPLALAKQQEEPPEGPDIPPGDGETPTPPEPGEQPGAGENQLLSENTPGGEAPHFEIPIFVPALIIIVAIGAGVAVLASRRKPEELAPVPP